MSNWRILAPFTAGAILAVSTGMVLDGYISPLLIWGGSDCETVNGVLGCFGYPPSGILVLLIGWTVVVFGGVEGVSRLRAKREGNT